MLRTVVKEAQGFCWHALPGRVFQGGCRQADLPQQERTWMKGKQMDAAGTPCPRGTGDRGSAWLFQTLVYPGEKGV